MGSVMRFSKRVIPISALAALMAGCATGSSVTALDPGFQALSSGDYSKARDAFAAAQARSPNDPYLQLDLGTAYQGMGRMDLAEPLYRQVLVDGTNVVPAVTTNPGDVGKSLATIACENLRLGLNTDPGC
jgi:hypothetical protein